MSELQLWLGSLMPLLRKDFLQWKSDLLSILLLKYFVTAAKPRYNMIQNYYDILAEANIGHVNS